MPDDPDLFGHPAGPVQTSLFGEGDERLQPPAQTFQPDPAVIRRRLNALLDKARNARAMPWPERDARMWRTVFPQMTDWLPEDEAEWLRLAFAREMERLGATT